MRFSATCAGDRNQLNDANRSDRRYDIDDECLSDDEWSAAQPASGKSAADSAAGFGSRDAGSA